MDQLLLYTYWMEKLWQRGFRSLWGTTESRYATPLLIDCGQSINFYLYHYSVDHASFVCDYVPILCFIFCLHWTGLGFASGESLWNKYIVKRWFASRIFKIMRSFKNVLKVCIQCGKDIIKSSKYFLMGNECIWI